MHVPLIKTVNPPTLFGCENYSRYILFVGKIFRRELVYIIWVLYQNEWRKSVLAEKNRCEPGNLR